MISNTFREFINDRCTVFVIYIYIIKSNHYIYIYIYISGDMVYLNTIKLYIYQYIKQTITN